MNTTAQPIMAIGGFDPVSYFSETGPVTGQEKSQIVWQNKRWLFANAENRETFNNNPEAYAPQHDGVCAFAARLGKTGPDAPQASPQSWSVFEDKLYMSSNGVAHFLWKLFFAPKGRVKRASLTLAALLAVFLITSATLAKIELPTGSQQGAILYANNEFLAPVNADPASIAIAGYDPVAYFLNGGPQAGSAEFSVEWNNAIWYFASANNAALFGASPESYAPQFGGHCAFAASVGKVAEGSPENWHIVEGRLFLYLNPVARQLYRILPNSPVSAYQNWPDLTQEAM